MAVMPFLLDRWAQPLARLLQLETGAWYNVLFPHLPWSEVWPRDLVTWFWATRSKPIQSGLLQKCFFLIQPFSPLSFIHRPAQRALSVPWSTTPSHRLKDENHYKKRVKKCNNLDLDALEQLPVQDSLPISNHPSRWKNKPPICLSHCWLDF